MSSCGSYGKDECNCRIGGVWWKESRLKGLYVYLWRGKNVLFIDDMLEV